MRLAPHVYRPFSVILSTILFLTNQLFGYPQASVREWNFPDQHNPLIAIWNASYVVINPWEKNEVSIRAEVLSPVIQPDDVKIKRDNHRLQVSCSPQKDARRVFLTLSVPAKSALDISSDSNLIQITDPTERISVGFTTKTFVQLSVPRDAELDMKGAPNAVARRQIPSGGGFEQFGISNSRMGTGPPYVKVVAAKSVVSTTIGGIEPLPRNPTHAATTIARRGGLMGQALRKSTPQLIQPGKRVDQNLSRDVVKTEEGSVKLETSLINLNVSVTDKAGKAIAGLTKEDFIVEEDGVPQNISFFSPQQSAFNLVLLIDLSGSMREEIDLIKDTAAQFLNVISAIDSIALVTFSTDVIVVSSLTKDREELRDSIQSMMAPAGGTAFYDALGFTLAETLRTVKGQRNAIIAISDGEDNVLQSQLARQSGRASTAAGSFLTFDELEDGVKEADALIYPIHLNPSPPPPPKTVVMGGSRNLPAPTVQIQTNVDTRKLSTSTLTATAIKQLRLLAEASGGAFYHADRIDDLKGVFEKIAAELRTVYSMAYTPTNSTFDGRFRRIKVRIRTPDIVIRTRPGYFGK
jgi:VWFA-related protein